MKILMECMETKNSSDSDVISLVDAKCEQGHPWSDLLDRISFVLFNVMGKNLIAQMNDQARSLSKRKNSGKRSETDRKVAKLQSNSA